MKRRSLIRAAGLGLAGGVLGLAGCATGGGGAHPRVLAVGGGYGGATAARYLRLWGEGRIDVTLIEPDEAFVSCPLSNLVLSGSRQMADITVPYTALRERHGVQVLRDRVSRIDTAARSVTLAGGSTLRYDRLVVSPGVELQLDRIEGLAAAHGAGQILQAWKAGPETAALRRQLQALPDGGVFAISIPEMPYRCPPGPYERACLAAWYLKQAKPRSKVIVFDANDDVTSKGALFKRAWATLYPGLVEYRPQHKLTGVDGASGTLRFEVQDDERAALICALPPMRAGSIAVQSGLANLANGRWCGVNYQTFESLVAPHVHVLGDSIQIASQMPKSGHMANGHAKVAAAAIVAQLRGWEPDPAPMLTNTCYSFVNPTMTVHVSSVHAYSAADKTYKPVPGSGGLSDAANELEGVYAFNWARNIWADCLG